MSHVIVKVNMMVEKLMYIKNRMKVKVCVSPLKHHVCDAVAKSHADPTKTAPINFDEKVSL